MESIKRYYINGKVVVHFLSLLTDDEYYRCEETAKSNGDTFSVDTKYRFALNKAKPFGGKKFHNKSFGGGIAFSNEQQLETIIKTL